MSIFSVYIEEGCITCDACEEAAPDVFEVTDDTCFIKPDARLDGGYDRNTDKSGLKPDVIGTLADDIMDAADACPCLLYTSPSPRDGLLSRMPSSA